MKLFKDRTLVNNRKCNTTIGSISPTDKQIAKYLQQIPLSSGTKENSDNAIMESLYNLVCTYIKKKIPDYELAQQTYAMN